MAAEIDRQDAQAGDGELAARAGAGDRAAFAELVERHYDFIYRVAYRVLGRQADAEDLAQDVCMRLGRAISGYRGGAAFTTWLYALVLNAGRDALRRNARGDRNISAFAAHAQLMAEESVGDDPAERMWEAVRTLPDKQREAMTLVYGEGLGHAAVADIMGVTENTVAWHVHEARKRLKALLRPAGDE